MATSPDSSEPAATELERDEQYEIVYAATRDAMYDVLGTAVLLAFALLFVYVGARGVVESMTEIGVVFLVLAALVAAAALDLVTPFRD